MNENMEKARYNMIEQQIRPWDVMDQGVLDLLMRIPRERFVPEAHHRLAFADVQIPIGFGEVMMAPRVEARLLQALAIRPSDRILEVGTGSGFLTACLASLGEHVVSVDIHREFTDAARDKLAALEIRNVTLETGDAANGWAGHGPFDVIAITGSMPLEPDEHRRELRVGGRLFVVLGKPPVREALLITRTGESHWAREELFETDLPELINAPQPQPFVF